MESNFTIWLKDKLRKYPYLFKIYSFYIVSKRGLSLLPLYLYFGKEYSHLLYKPTLPYLEIDIVSHCNLSCRGCSHFSPIAEIWFADILEFERDMKRLKLLFSKIELIRILGGEPLLHPDIERFIILTRTHFRNSRISIATNGYSVCSMKDSFWTACRENQIKINLSIYPPLYNKANEILTFIKSKKVIVYSDKQDKFRSILNLSGDSDPFKAFKFCRATAFVPYLYKGKIYICSRPVVVKSFNKRFGTQIPSGGFIDIHDNSINGWDILLSITKPGPTCRFCVTSKFKFPWRESRRDMYEWSIPLK
jgi:hypothetical protein